MADIYLQSNAKGDWGYEVVEDKLKVNYKISFGLNTLSPAHMKVIEKNPWYKAMIKKKVYKVLNQKDLAKAEQEESKELDAANEVEEVKKVCKEEIAKAKQANDQALKTQQTEHNAKMQQMVESRADALNKVNELEDENVKLNGQLSEVGAGSKKETELLEKKIKDQKAEFDKSLADLKVDAEKKIKALEGEKKALEKQVAEHAKEIKELKAK
jgi:small-conductance mechanosensitive channel